ncbi:hypothetical protein C8Q80DRAFT_1141598 [Daedaleopsis nitida]|nr:hypothetical protein C8Q80DRAFT_1141598 [Daedaleopsis nitida]
MFSALSERQARLQAPAILVPLLQLRELEHVVLGIPLRVDDYSVRQISAAWPKVSTLMLGGSADDPTASVSIPTLAHLVTRCNELTRVRIPLNTDLSQVPLAVCALRCAFGHIDSHLNTLDVGLSKVHDPATLALYFSYFAGNLQEIMTDWTEEWVGDSKEAALQAKGWSEIEELMDVLVNVRAQESFLEPCDSRYYKGHGVKLAAGVDLLTAARKSERISEAYGRMRQNERSREVTLAQLCRSEGLGLKY